MECKLCKEHLEKKGITFPKVKQLTLKTQSRIREKVVRVKTLNLEIIIVKDLAIVWKKIKK